MNDLDDELRQFDADYFLIANYQQILDHHIFTMPRLLTINFHPSPLPRYAGLRPHYWMWRYGERKGGVTAINLNKIIDGGDIVDQITFPLNGNESEKQLKDIHFTQSVKLLLLILDRMPNLDTTQFKHQDLSLRTYFSAQKYKLDNPQNQAYPYPME